MSNQLNMAQINSIRTLLERGWSQRKVGRELGINRSTVARYVRLFAEEDSKAANSTPGSPIEPIPKQAISTPGVSGRQSTCQEFSDDIIKKLEDGLSAKRIHQDLVEDEDFQGSYQCVKRFVRRVQKKHPLPFRRIETAAGEECQVDFGQGAFVKRGKIRRRPHLMRVVLSFSRAGYSEATWTQSSDDFIRTIENSFHHFGGVPRFLVPDNLKAAVINPDWYDPDLNPKFESFARHYGFIILPTKPRTPRHKGKVEAGVKYAQNNFAKGRTFDTIEEQNRSLIEWELKVANQRIHGTTQRQVRLLLEEERHHLLPLPDQRFPIFEEAERKVHIDGHVILDRAYYSVPPEYVGRTVWVRWDSRFVRIYSQKMEKLASHSKSISGRFNTLSHHIDEKKINSIERGEDYLLERARLIGEHSGQWAMALLAKRGIQGLRTLQGFLALTKKHPVRDIEEASRIALSHDAFRLKTLRHLLKKSEGEQLTFLERHPMIRDMAEYAQFAEFAKFKNMIHAEMEDEKP